MGINEDGRFAHRMNDPMGGSPASGISDEQFAELKRLLHPIHHLAKVHLKEKGHVEHDDGTWHDPNDEKSEDKASEGEFKVGDHVEAEIDGKKVRGEVITADAEKDYYEIGEHDNDEEHAVSRDQMRHDGGEEFAPVRDPLDAPEDRDPEKMPAEEPQRQFHETFAEPEPDVTEAEAEAHRQNDLMKARPNQGTDQASLTGGESMVQRNLAETQAREAEAGPELEGGAASAKDKDAAEGFGAKPLAPPKRTLPGK